jgi:hypothetical protein
MKVDRSDPSRFKPARFSFHCLCKSGFDTTAYEDVGPVTYGGVPGEYRRAAAVSRPLMHDIKPPGLTRPCGTILAVR